MNPRVPQLKWDEMKYSRDESDIEGGRGGPGKEPGRDRGVSFPRFIFRTLRKSRLILLKNKITLEISIIICILHHSQIIGVKIA